MTTVAQVNTSVPRPFPVLSMNAMMRTKRFRCFSGGIGAALHRRRVAAAAAGRAIFLQRLFSQFAARRLARPPCFHNDIEQGLQRETAQSIGSAGRTEDATPETKKMVVVAADNEVEADASTAAPLGQSAHHLVIVPRAKCRLLVY